SACAPPACSTWRRRWRSERLCSTATPRPGPAAAGPAREPTVISPTAEYALRAVVCLANAAPAPQTNQQIAATTKVPSAYLSKVLQGLARAGIIRSQRGLRGGYTLQRDLEALTVLEVVETVDPLRR